MIEKRSIPRLPEPPFLTPELISLLTELCFVPNSSERSEVLFTFGIGHGFHELFHLLKKVISEDEFSLCIITGGKPNFIDHPAPRDSEAQIIYRGISTFLSSGTSVILEEESTNTRDNVKFAKKKMENIPFTSMRYVCRSFASRRCQLTLSKYFPNVELYLSSYHMMGGIEKIPLRPDNWPTFKEGRGRVWGEYLRIRQYGRQGQIDYLSVKELIDKIESLTEPLEASL